MVGTILDENTVQLDGDTFRILFSLDDSTLCVRPKHEEDGTLSMVVRKYGDSLYHNLVEGESIYEIDNTERFVRLNDTIVYELETGWKRNVAYWYHSEYYYHEYLEYLGEWDSQPIFTNLVDWQSLCLCGSAISFPNGRVVELRENTYTSQIGDDSTLTLTRGALSIKVSPAELYDYHQTSEVQDRETEAICKRYEESSIGGWPGFGVNIDVPKGSSRMAVTVKKYLFRAICNDIFAHLDYDAKQLYYNSAIERGDIRSALEQVSKVWCREVRKKFSDIDYVYFYFPINVTKVAEGDDYATYYYKTDALLGGAHDNPRSFYITYDKQRNEIVDANNTIKEGMINAFKEKVPDWVNQQYEFWCHGDSLGGDYPCDEIGGCFSTNKGDLHLPLPHLAILPDGVVISFHPYQIGSFADGEFHVLIPKEDIKDFLDHDFWNNDSITKPLSYFVKN